MKRALLLPGQGSQYPGMAHDLYKEYDYIRNYFDNCNDLLQRESQGNCPNILSLMFGDNSNDLKQTINCQTSIYMHSTAIWQILAKEKQISLNDFRYYLGHSLGEYSGLSINKSFDTFENGLKYVYKRSYFMNQCCDEESQIMMAIVALRNKVLDVELISDIIEKENKQQLANGNGGGGSDDGSMLPVCQIANVNSPKQIILSGDTKYIENRICKQIEKALFGDDGDDDSSKKKSKDKYIKFIKLETGGAFHSSLMKNAEKNMFDQLTNDCNNGLLSLSLPLKTVIHNASDTVFSDTSNTGDNKMLRGCESIDEMIQLLSKQITSPILWQKWIHLCLLDGVNEFIEIGPKNVLSRLVSQTSQYYGYKDIIVRNVDTLNDIQSFQL